MKLYGYWRSSSSWRVRIALAHKALTYEHAPVHLLKEGGEQHHHEHTARNPMNQVPVLEVVEDGRTLHLSQSLAILEYLEDRFPSPPLLPAGRAPRAASRQLAEMVNSGIQPLQNLSVLRRLKNDLGLDEVAWAHHVIERGLGAIEAVLEKTAGRFAVGDAPSFADVCLVPQLYNARRYKVALDPFKVATRVEASCAALPAFAVSHPDRQPDAEVAK